MNNKSDCCKSGVESKYFAKVKSEFLICTKCQKTCVLKEELPNCVQCAQPMSDTFSGLPFCGRPDCPNYGLLQTGIMGLKKLINKK